MITEDYVSFEIAKFLNEKGFDGECDYYYPEDGGEMQQLLTDELYYHNEDFIKCPTLQMAMKWLREIHKIGIFPSTYTLTNVGGTEKYHHYGTAIINLATYELMTDDIIPRCSYEEAVEAALKYSLKNLI